MTDHLSNKQVKATYNKLKPLFNDIKFKPILTNALDFKENLLVPSNWCENYVYLPSKITSTPGRMDFSSTPFLKDIVDTLNNDNIKEVTIMKSTQVGISLCLILLSLYIISQRPSNILFTLPDLNMCKEFSGKRLQPLMTGNKKLINRQLTGDYHDITNMVYNFRDMFLKFATANSPAALASSAVKYLLIDEIDKFPQNLSREADPISLARERLRTYVNSKIYLSSTPTNEYSKIAQYFENSNKQYFKMPCPECKEPFKFEFSRDTFKFPTKLDNYEYLLNGNDPYDSMYNQIYYLCPHCQHRIYNLDKFKLIKKGVWTPDNPLIKEKVGFHINAFYSRYITLADIAYEFLTSKDSPDKLRNFKNSWCGEIFDESHNNKVKSFNIDIILKDQEEHNNIKYNKGDIPDDVLFLTGGVDIQMDKLFAILLGVAPNKKMYIIDYREMATFEDVGKYFKLLNTNNKKVPIISLDSRYRTPEVYNFTRLNSEKNIKFINIKGKGIRYQEMGKPYSIKKIDAGDQYYTLNVDYYKDMVANLINNNNILFPQDVDQVLLEHFKVEQKVRDPNTGVIRWMTPNKKVENHYWDCIVYALFAVDLTGYFTTDYANNNKKISTNNIQKKSPPKRIKRINTGRGTWL